MTRTLLIGDLPLHTKGMNVNRLDRKRAAELYGLTDAQLHKAYNNWIQIFRMEGSTLTFQEYLNKLDEASITPDEVGTYNHQYQLSRVNDEGPYTKESCRFLLKTENFREQVDNGSHYVYGRLAQ